VDLDKLEGFIAFEKWANEIKHDVSIMTAADPLYLKGHALLVINLCPLYIHEQESLYDGQELVLEWIL
jgi:hypothetical protein